MRVHIVSNLFSPDELAGASLYTDMAQYLASKGHDVRVTTTFSYYPAWKLAPEDEGVKVRDDVFCGIPVRRVSMYVPEKPSGKARLLSDLSFFWSLVRRGRFRGWHPDVVLTALPALSQCLAQRFMYGFRRVPKLIIVQDFAVEAALELGILKVPFASRFLKGVQRWGLKSAQTLATISPLMLEKLRGDIGSIRKLLFIPNWIHLSLQDEIDRQLSVGGDRKPTSLFYAGNMGVKQGLPDFLAQFRSAGAAKNGWKLDLYGGGAEAENIRSAAAVAEGVSVGGVLEETEYVSNLLSASACLVTQRPGVGANFLPSKLLPALATATPVLAVCSRNSPLADEVVEGGFGEVVEPGDSEALRVCLERWKSDPSLLRRYSECAKVRAQRYHRDVVLAQYEQELSELAKRGS